MRLVQARILGEPGRLRHPAGDCCEEIGHDIGTPYSDIRAIDLALRTGRIGDLPEAVRHLPGHAAGLDRQQAVASMLRWIDASYSFQNIILVGEGRLLV